MANNLLTTSALRRPCVEKSCARPPTKPQDSTLPCSTVGLTRGKIQPSIAWSKLTIVKSFQTTFPAISCTASTCLARTSWTLWIASSSRLHLSQVEVRATSPTNNSGLLTRAVTPQVAITGMLKELTTKKTATVYARKKRWSHESAIRINKPRRRLSSWTAVGNHWSASKGLVITTSREKEMKA